MSYSRGEISTFVMPHMQNVLGDLFGGHLMSLVDQAAAVAAIRHAGGPAVTASIDRVDFRERIPVGALVTCVATVDYVGNSSMDIAVEVYAENVSTGEKRHTHTAHAVFVAIDQQGKPKRVPRLVAETEEERARYERARLHREEIKRELARREEEEERARRARDQTRPEELQRG
ncbi:MAG TPA: acyl-CoA thioesterase [Gemmatimonadales bacterium]|nr:acyl-CoA thioesterase [Gemmatimonadales bacterium]